MAISKRTEVLIRVHSKTGIVQRTSKRRTRESKYNNNKE
jgi:hypothetical protein